jgi:hypothetical protein
VAKNPIRRENVRCSDVFGELNTDELCELTIGDGCRATISRLSVVDSGRWNRDLTPRGQRIRDLNGEEEQKLTLKQDKD